MTVIITPDDLAPFATITEAKAQAMIDDAMAMAVRVAPCLTEATDAGLIAAAKAILRRAILRWNEAGAAGSRTQVSEQAGSFSHSETSESTGSKGLFWPSEINELAKLCQTATSTAPRGAYTIDMTGLGKSSNPLQGAVINTACDGPTPIGSWSPDRIDPATLGFW